MKLLRHYLDSYEADVDAERLEGKGILTHVTSRYSQDLNAIRTGAFQSGLWAVLEYQYEDAKECLKNDSYKASTGLSPQELKELKESLTKKSQKIINIVAVIAAGVCVFTILIFAKYGLSFDLPRFSNGKLISGML